ncbi:MAG: type II toxin-antitoxin system RelE/ParE family toxin [Candidatus Kapabacteria bacterium]|nr:type II toxin-antitoxin system RelE/ParE family toxin [Candidatus Kapabacteria bacterium]
MPIRYFPAARQDIENALTWSGENFGAAALERYKALLAVALKEIHANPNLLHSYEEQGLQEGIRLYHIRHSRKRAAVEGEIVGNPRHIIAFMVKNGDTLIVRVLHDRMEITPRIEESL